MPEDASSRGTGDAILENVQDSIPRAVVQPAVVPDQSSLQIASLNVEDPIPAQRDARFWLVFFALGVALFLSPLELVRLDEVWCRCSR